MNPPDELSTYYAELLEGTYDCVDRIVLNAFFPLGQTGGGFRTWWRRLRGSDADLDDEHLRDLAGTFSRRVRAYCQAERIPLVEAQVGERKRQLAEPHLPKDPQFQGLFLVITGNAPAPVWEVKHNAEGQIIEIQHRRQWPFVKHYYFHLMDRHWGHVVVRLCGYLRYDRFFVILATHGTHPFFTAEAQRLRDIRRQPLHFLGYAVGCRKGRDGRRWHPSVRIERERFRELKARFTREAVQRSVEELCRELGTLGYEPYAPVRDQLFGILRAVNRQRQTAALESVPVTTLPRRRAPVKPFG